jgi:hypothetical protein
LFSACVGVSRIIEDPSVPDLVANEIRLSITLKATVAFRSHDHDPGASVVHIRAFDENAGVAGELLRSDLTGEAFDVLSLPAQWGVNKWT